jgi:hypothetical protein
MGCHATDSAIWFTNPESLEGGCHVPSAGDEVGYLGEQNGFDEERVDSPRDVKEVAECDEQRLGELLLCPVPAINRPQLLDAQITKIGLYSKAR